MELGKARQKSDLYEICRHMTTDAMEENPGPLKNPRWLKETKRSAVVESPEILCFFAQKKHLHPQHQTSQKNYSEFICWLIHSHLKSLKSLNIL